MQKILYLHAGAEMYGADKVLMELIKGLDKDAFEAHLNRMIAAMVVK